MDVLTKVSPSLLTAGTVVRYRQRLIRAKLNQVKHVLCLDLQLKIVYLVCN